MTSPHNQLTFSWQQRPTVAERSQPKCDSTKIFIQIKKKGVILVTLPFFKCKQVMYSQEEISHEISPKHLWQATVTHTTKR